MIKRLFRAADELICATDAGREGELIFRYILELTGATAKPARRLWLNSLTVGAIRDAFRRLRPLADYDALYGEAETISHSSVIAARPRKGGKARPQTLRARIVRRLPGGLRRALQRAKPTG